MKIAFATIFDSLDITRGSGTFFYLSKELERQGHQLIRVGPLILDERWPTRLLKALHRRAGRRYLTWLDPYVGRRTGRQVEARLNGCEFDVLLTNDLSIAAFTRIDRPKVIYTDAMITKDYREGSLPDSRVANLSNVGLWLSRITIKKALGRSALAVFGADWAAREARRYDSGARIEVVHFGANIEDPGAQIAEERVLSIRRDVRLLFVGKDWVRKGGDIAVRTVRVLRGRGIMAELDVVGASPPLDVNDSAVRVHGILNKAIEKDRELLTGLFRAADILILPSTSEGFVIAALEAAAFGLPVVGFRAIGVDTAVRNGETGILLELDATEEDFADVICHLIQRPAEFQRLVRGARKFFENSVNWSRAGSELTRMINRYTRCQKDGDSEPLSKRPCR